MAKYEKYTEYQDSGVKWLGLIPEHWSSFLFKRVVANIKDGTHGTHARVENGELLLSAKNVFNSGIEIGENESYIPVKDYEEITSNGFPKKGDILVTCVGTIGRSFVYPFDKSLAFQRSVSFIRLNKKGNAQFYKYFIESKAYQSQLESLVKSSAQGGIYMGDLINTVVINCPLDEQVKIANFLDHETAKIDSLIAKQEKLIELLKEKRQAVISHAVTKGLNPDVNMKDSGVEWLGQVPEHWEILKFDYAINTVSDIDHYMPNSVDEGIPYVMTGDLQDFVSDIDFESCKKVAYSDYQKLSRKIKTTKDDIIFARYATIGTLSYVDVDKEFLVSYSCVTIKSNPLRTTGKYLSYYLKSQAFLQAIQQQINSNTQGNVGVDSLRNVKIILPLLSEQDAIIEFLKVELSKMDNLIDKAQSAIQLMQERRTALISSAVTGKIDVRHHASRPTGNDKKQTEDI